MMKHRAFAWLAVMLFPVFIASVTVGAAAPVAVKALTLANLRAPVARICGTKGAASIAQLWDQLATCGKTATTSPAPGPSPSPTTAPSPSPTATPQPVPSPTVGGDGREGLTPIASNFDRRLGLAFGNFIPPSNAPDVLGAFRFICTAGTLNYDDAIVYPGQPGRSHLHQNFGNLTISAFSTYASLRAAGDSTCGGINQRSAYWVPAMMTEDGKVIQPDYVSVYYKRRKAGDPLCFVQAIYGCIGLPTGIKGVTGWDHERMGQPQPENKTGDFRCVEPGRPSLHRDTIPEALADCGGEGQIIGGISMGQCWNGKLDSPDHRRHITHPYYDGSGPNPVCRPGYKWIIPDVTLGVAWTIKKSDGKVALSCDMGMAPGTCFHADFFPAWDPPTQATWEANCISKLLNCSGGQLGDGSGLIGAPQVFKAAQRLVAAPPRPGA